MRLHRHLEGQGAPPDQWVISRVCEEFRCLPTEAVRELERCEGLVFDIIEMRAYAKTKQAIDDADASEGRMEAPKDAMADLVSEIEVELWQARNARWAEADGEGDETNV